MSQGFVLLGRPQRNDNFHLQKTINFLQKVDLTAIHRGSLTKYFQRNTWVAKFRKMRFSGIWLLKWKLGSTAHHFRMTAEFASPNLQLHHNHDWYVQVRFRQTSTGWWGLKLRTFLWWFPGNLTVWIVYPKRIGRVELLFCEIYVEESFSGKWNILSQSGFSCWLAGSSLALRNTLESISSSR